MNDRQIKSFIDVVESGSFSKAEDGSYISRQALKKHIDSLENELGFTLLVRSSKGIVLTSIGKQYYEGIKKIMADLDALTDKCKDMASHEHIIRIGNPSHPRLLLEYAFLEFSKRYPYIKQEVIFPDAANIVDAVLDGTVDVAECILPHDLDKQKIEYVKLMDTGYNCLLSEAHPLAKKSAILPEELSGNVIGLRQRGNMELIQDLKTKCNGITLVETAGNEMHNLFTFCYNHGIFISRAYYATKLPPLITIPLITDFKAECCIIYKKSHSQIVKNFVKVVRGLYPIDMKNITMNPTEVNRDE